MTSSRSRSHIAILSLATALPVVVFLVFAGSGLAALILGRPLFWRAENVTLSEAIALEDLGETMRLLADGADPDAVYDVGDRVEGAIHRRLRPLEASVLTRERYMTSVVLDYGATLDETMSARLQCLARATGAEDIETLLIERSQPIASCNDVTLPWDPTAP